MTKAVGIVVAVLCWAALLVEPSVAEKPFTLEAVRAQVKQDHDQVPHLATAALSDALDRGEDVLLLDSRERAEYAVSHIRGALRVDPNAWTSSVVSRFGDKVRGKRVVVYCSVGERSSRLAGRIQGVLKKRGAVAVYNLDGGIFAWHNEGRPLVDARGATPFVHPYDSHWGRLVKRSGLTRTTPAQ